MILISSTPFELSLQDLLDAAIQANIPEEEYQYITIDTDTELEYGGHLKTTMTASYYNPSRHDDRFQVKDPVVQKNRNAWNQSKNRAQELAVVARKEYKAQRQAERIATKQIV